MKTLVLDVGGTNVKLAATGHEVTKFPSGPTLRPAKMIATVRDLVKDWEYEAVSIGFPAPVVRGKLLRDPMNLGPGWTKVDFAKEFSRPVRLINDAAMQALGSYEGGRMLFLGLGTGLGAAMVADNVVIALELAHMPYKKDKTFEDYVGERGMLRMGKKRWTAAVYDVIMRLRSGLVAESVVLGGGNAKKLRELPDGIRVVDNKNAIIGGFRMWQRKYVLP
jgi:predicted NBD/HSP70 family sugar kinase